MFGHIMVPYDMSEPAGSALKFAIDLAEKYSAKISVVTYVPLSSNHSSESITHVDTTQLKHSVTYSLSKLDPMLREHAIPYELTVVEGSSTTEALLAYAEMHNVDVIVMGSRGLGGFRKMLMGSVASSILQHSKVPVLIVKKPQDA